MVARRRALAADLKAARRIEARAERVRRYLPVLDAELRDATAPFIDAIRVKTACRERWEDMEGGVATRRCARCDRDVYDLSQMTRDEIATLFTRAAESPCVRLSRRFDGRVVTADCPADAGAYRARGLRAVAAAALVAGGLAAGATLSTLGGATAPGEREEPLLPQPAKRVDRRVEALDPSAMFEPDPVDRAIEATVGAPIARQVRRTGARTWEVDRALVDQALDHPAPCSRGTRVIPHMDDGRVVGVKLYGIRRSSLLFALGIRNGDLLRSVNGIELMSPDAALRAYARLRDADALFVHLVRRGAERTHAYRLVR